MKANELRVGNLIHYLYEDSLDDPPNQVALNVVDHEDLRILTEFPDDPSYCPIPLTEEWLKRLGCKVTQASETLYFPAPSIKAELHFTKFRGGLVCEVYCSTGVIIPNDIKYVHQLQNLFFALTGEELNFNTEKP